MITISQRKQVKAILILLEFSLLTSPGVKKMDESDERDERDELQFFVRYRGDRLHEVSLKSFREMQLLNAEKIHEYFERRFVCHRCFETPRLQIVSEGYQASPVKILCMRIN